jgi:hypothetical protein
MTETPVVERESLDQMGEALAAFQAEMPTVTKTKTAKVKTNSGADYSYTYADLADVTQAAMPLLAKHGLSFTCSPGREGLTATLLHTSGQRLTGILPITGATPQAVGSSLTYARRYLFGCLTGVVTDDDDDGRQAEQAARAPRRAPERRPEPRPPVAPLATPENPAPDGSVDVPLPDPEPDPKAAAPQVLKAMHAGLAEVMPRDVEREDRLEITGAIVGHPITSTKELTRDEVYRVLGFVERAKTGMAGIVRREGQWHAVAYDPEPGGPP